MLDKNETWIFTAPARTAVAGLYTNVATVQGTAGGITYYDNDPATYFGWVVGLQIAEGDERGRPDQPDGARGRQHGARPDPPDRHAGRLDVPRLATPGTSRSPITVKDDFGTASNAGRRLRAEATSSGDTNGNGKIDPSEIWLFTSAGVSELRGEGRPVRERRDASRAPRPTARRVTATDRSYHFGATAIADRQKAVNAVDPWHPTIYEDANFAPGVGAPDRLDRHVDVPRAHEHRRRRRVDLDRPSPTTAASPARSRSSPTSVDADDDGFNDGDVNHNNLLDPGETWLFRATGTVAGPARTRTRRRRTASSRVGAQAFPVTRDRRREPPRHRRPGISSSSS